MAVERIGLRRLYEAKGYSVHDASELQLAFTLRGHHVEVYLGHKPKIGVERTRGERYVVPSQTGGKSTIAFGRDALDADCPEPLFLEILCLKDIEVPDSVSADFRRKAAASEQPLLAKVEASMSEIRATLDLVAGVIGLRFHRQFVLIIWTENPVAARGDEFIRRISGPTWEMLEQLELNATGIERIHALLPALNNAEAAIKDRAASAFGCLLRAWNATDSLTRFMSLFIPIEIVLAGHTGGQEKAVDRGRTNDRIRSILQEQPGSEPKELIRHFEYLVGLQRPGLAERFEELARKAQIPGWRADIEAFRRFNRIRNGVLHRGEQDVQLTVTLGNDFRDQVSQLEDIAERYVNWAFFRDHAVYQSRWRPDRKVFEEALEG